MMRGADFARLVALAAIWGLSFVFIRVLAEPLGPFAMAAFRLLIGGAVLAMWLGLSGREAKLREYWRFYLLLGIVNCALPFVLYGYAAFALPASTMVILNAALPLFSALLAARWLGEPLDRVKLAGITVGIAGVALVTGGIDGLNASALVAVAASLAAVLSYAIGAVGLKRAAPDVSPYAIAAWTQLFGAAPLLPIVVASPPPGPWTLGVVLNLLGLALLCSAVAYLLYFRLIRDVGPTRAATVTFLMPVFGIGWGAWLLDEAVTPVMVAGMALILAGTSAVLRKHTAAGSTAAAHKS
ncbi:MAG TPA: DMT family transporter [Casimicrobiaceae bacterium]|nr:DMT family transporter [Casimicrobiaceae bacterium]